MKKLIVFCSVLWSYTVLGFGIPDTEDDSLYIQKIISYGENLLSKDENKAIHYLDSVHQVNSNKGFSIDLTTAIGSFYKENKLNDQALLYFEKAYNKSREMNDHKKTIKLSLELSKDYSRLGKFDSGLLVLNEGLLLAKELPDSMMIGICSYYLGKVYQLQGDLDASLDATQKALTVFRELNEVKRINHTLNQIGITYCLVGQEEKSLDIFKESANNSLALGDSAGYKSAMNNLSIVLKRMKKYDEAIRVNLELIELNKRLNDQASLAKLYNNNGICYSNLKQFDSASYYYELALEIKERQGDQKDIASTLTNIGILKYRDAKYQEAIAYLNRSLDISEEIGTLFEQVNSWEYIASSYKQMGNYRKSLNAFEKYQVLADSLKGIEINNKIAELETKYETAEKEREIEKLEKNKLIQQERIQKANMTRNFLLTGIVLSVIMVFLIYLVHRNRVRTTKLIAAKNLELREQKIREMEKARQIENMQSMIRGQEEERQRIARELHDEIQNQLVVVKTRLEKLKSSNVNNKDIEEAGKQIDLANVKTRRISHGMVPMVLQRFGLQGAVEQVLNDANAAKPELKINKQIIGLDQRLDPVVELNLYRITQEIINNMLKHAHATESTLILSKTDHRINLSFEDNGLGFDPSDPAFSEGMGLQNIRSRLLILNGTWQIESKANKGTNIEINIPINQNSQNHDQSFHSRRPPGGH